MANYVGTSICECGAHIDPRGGMSYVSGETSRFWKEHSKPGHRVIPPEEVMELCAAYIAAVSRPVDRS